jgi:exosortase/archaeosortase family protein
VGSFFVYYVVALVFPGTSFYTTANYTVYLLGLFLVFFKFSALKEAFTPVFLIVTAFSSSFIVGWLRPFLSPYVNDFAHITVNVLRTLGIDASISYYRYLSNTPIISLTSLSGEIVQTTFVYGCMGIYSVLIFSVLLVVILFEDPSSSKVKLTYSIVGLLGTFVLNIFRFAIILLVDYFYGAEVGGAVHYVIGYVLFSAWL